MASIEEYYENLQPYFTLSNQKIIIIAKVKEETIYFYDFIDRNTTIILLTDPVNYCDKEKFINIIIDIGSTVIDLNENESMDENYKLSDRSKKIIADILLFNNYEKIITHPKNNRNYDPQNREIYDYISYLIKYKGTNNHYTYNRSKNKINSISNKKKNAITLYCCNDNKKYTKYINITSYITGLINVSEHKLLINNK